jgi:hypothetical protein
MVTLAALLQFFQGLVHLGVLGTNVFLVLNLSKLEFLLKKLLL